MRGDLPVSFEARVLRAPLNQPFRIATGQHTSLENALFTIELGDGTKGYGEAGVAPHITGETLEETLANLTRIGRALVGKDLSQYPQISSWLHAELPRNKAALAAVEMAVFDALTRRMRVPLWKLFGTTPRTLTTDITIVLSDLPETEESARRFYRQGLRKFKIKIGKDFDVDLARVAAVRRVCRNCELILDANQGYAPREMLKFLRELRKMKIVPALLEQPVKKADWEGLKEVAAKSPVPVCADESCSSIADCLRIIKERAVPAINIKVMKTGMVHSREIACLCRANNIRLMIGAMMESSLATTASAHLAAGMGCFDFIDLDTSFFIKPGYDRNPWLSRKGVYNLSRVKAGIGIIPVDKR